MNALMAVGALLLFAGVGCIGIGISQLPAQREAAYQAHLRQYRLIDPQRFRQLPNGDLYLDGKRIGTKTETVGYAPLNPDGTGKR